MKLHNKKTGDIWEISKMRYPTAQEDDISFFAMLGTKGELFCYRSIAELNEDWEDYTPAEPLIKDEKIRKAVRAWAALYDGSAIRVHIGEDYVALFKDEVNGYSSSVEIDLSPEVFNELIDTHYYTIDELCGEEEE